MTEIAHRTAFITGGANGIGLGIARSLARAGAKLALIDLDSLALERAAAELGQVTEVAIAVLDVRDRAAYARVADDVEAKLGPVSILVNNAGVAGGAPADRLTYELWDWGMGINLGGVINGVQAFLPRIVERGGGGHIVNTASGAGLYATGGGVLYATAKFAVVGLSEALGVELEDQNIGVTVLCPGPVATDIIARTRAAQPRVTKSMSAAQRSNAFARQQVMTDSLAQGTPPDAVGDMVLAAIRENRLYVHTDRSSMDPIAARTAALLAAMPPAA
ncbi:SDR family oxidoreductase [Chelatococcus reniformis]|uniref:Short-chain type dehydrogenase/reductase n=1 Tax=Chelatococcus reniformis TaxID=1494448 RepID=A0A916UUA1_9HYPH|nr:SDR family NAD(P)-dependent oxidoreductase [Chelatococcus reniformis]GGC88099.1 short-chain type dehydrogenase/reductase [Chelatococcus reniformis]